MTTQTSTQAACFFETAYARAGFAAQRRYPNEELCRFMGRHFFSLPRESRRAISVLEVGCGSGANLWMIAREGFDAYGIDLSPEAIDLARLMLADYGTRATLATADMTQCPFPDGKFDAVVDVFSSYCLDEHRFSRFLHEISRLLKPGGMFFSYTPSKASDAFRNHAPARLIDGSTLNGICRSDSPFAGNHYPFRFTTREEYTAALADNGLDVSYAEQVGRTYGGGTEYFEFIVLAAEKVAE